MSATISTALLRRLLEATPEKLAAVERFLSGEPLPDTPQAQHPDPPRFALRRDGDVWHLTFDAREAMLKHEQGVYYLAEMLTHPGERIKKLHLAAKYSGLKSRGLCTIEVYDPATGRIETPASMEPVHEAALATDDLEARNACKARARELKETIEDPTETDAAKMEAREELEQIVAHLRRDNRVVRDPTKASGDAIRSALKKLLRNLMEPGGSAGTPQSVRREFAQHIERYLLIPSRRFGAPQARMARGELTGCLLYEPPAGVTWIVRQ
jgi:hypothetical protein